jgi:hypothetical protein
MKRHPVQSSALKSLGYDGETETLEVEFHGGAVWQYLEVPQALYDGLRDADSKGAHFHAHIVPYYASQDMGRPA